MAGETFRVDVWRFTQLTDDSVGGANITGTVVYAGVPARIVSVPEEMLLLQQGAETLRTFRVRLQRGILDVRENDEILFTFPPTGHFYNKKFRVIGVNFSGMSPYDPRSQLMLTVDRSERAHSG
ncbi:hypothetical protein D6833_11720 [Candidatus Parcubacteria bacterium]|nr:MAG: hypothetical protein D6833_11720 [Candidatus Parcubacteria bacterium]